jgi:hypothetical protein
LFFACLKRQKTRPDPAYDPAYDRNIGKTGKVGMLKGLEKLDLNYRTLTLFLPSSLAK